MEETNQVVNDVAIHCNLDHSLISGIFVSDTVDNEFNDLFDDPINSSAIGRD